MSDEMISQDSDSDYDPEHYSDEEDMDDINDYYREADDPAYYHNKPVDIEAFEVQLLHVEDVERLLNECVEELCQAIQVPPALAKVLLHTHEWMVSDITDKYTADSEKLLADSRIKPAPSDRNKEQPPKTNFTCPVCMQNVPSRQVHNLSCGHNFCCECWQMYFDVQIRAGISTGLECMAKDCDILVPEDLVYRILTNPKLRQKYQEFTFSDHVKSHPELRYCPGPNCNMVVRAQNNKAKRVLCTQCNTTFCFKCGLEYHVPTGCDTIKRWLTKCADDSETANYISANTKDCPRCHVCIEKNGGCNHMQCTKCKHDFCWMCLGEWKTHGSEYYECSKYKENPNIVNESAQAQAREALKKYLFYFERWENHAKSLNLEEQTLKKKKVPTATLR